MFTWVNRARKLSARFSFASIDNSLAFSIYRYNKWKSFIIFFTIQKQLENSIKQNHSTSSTMLADWLLELSRARTAASVRTNSFTALIACIGTWKYKEIDRLGIMKRNLQSMRKICSLTLLTNRWRDDLRSVVLWTIKISRNILHRSHNFFLSNYLRVAEASGEHLHWKCCPILHDL